MRDAIATKGSRRLMLVAVGLLAAAAVLPLLVPSSAVAWVRDFGSSLDNSPGRLQEAEDRLALLERLKRKHGPSLDEVVAAWEKLQQEHALLTNADAGAADLERTLSEASATFLTKARTLSAKRHEAGHAFARALEGELAESGDGAHQVRGPADDRRSGRAVDRRRHRQRRVLPLAQRRRGPPAAGPDRLGRRTVACHAGVEDPWRTADAVRPRRSSSTRSTPASAAASPRVVGQKLARSAIGSRCSASRTCRRSPPAAARTS